MENDAPVVGPDAPTANSKMVKLDIATPGLESANFRFAHSPRINADLESGVFVSGEYFSGLGVQD